MENEVNEALKEGISKAHIKAEYSTHEARTHMKRAITDRVICASLVEKAKQMHKQDLLTWLADTGITGQQVKAYLSLHDAAQKRPALNDKRQLLLCGILETAESQPRNVSPVPPSVINTASSFIGKFNKVVTKRPVEDWGDSERQQVKDVLAPIIEFYNSL